MTATLSYNRANSLLGESYAGGTLGGLGVTTTYDAYLRRASVGLNTQPSTLVNYSYDEASRLKDVVNGIHSATYAYLENSPLIGQIEFKQSGTKLMTTSKQYDKVNRLTSIASANSQGNSLASFAYDYNAANQRTQTRLMNGSYWVYNYDALGQVVSGKKYWADGSPVAGQQFEYAFDEIGNRTGTKAGGDQNGANLRSASYSPNLLNQYSSRTVPRAFDVTGVGFATNSVTVNGLMTYRKGEYFQKELGLGSSAAWWTNTQVQAGGSTTSGYVFTPATPEMFQYDLDGNLTNDGRWSYWWDGENRLTNMVANTTKGPQLNIRFEYDWQGRRIAKRVWNNIAASGSPVLDEKYVYDGWNLIAILNPDLSPRTSFVWGTDLSGSMQGAGGVGGLLAVYDRANGVHFTAFDGNGNIAALIIAATGEPSAQYEYGPFGELLRATGPMAKTNPFRFSTKYQDDETDLLSYGYRYYNPSTGSWLSRDPLQETGELNSYSFVQNNAPNSIDLLGLMNEPPPTITIPDPSVVSINGAAEWVSTGMLIIGVNAGIPALFSGNQLHIELSGRACDGCLDPSSIKVEERAESRIGWVQIDREKEIGRQPCATGKGYSCYSYKRTVWWESTVLDWPSWLDWVISKHILKQSISVSVTICADGTKTRSFSGVQSGGWPTGLQADDLFKLVGLQ